MFNRRPLFIHVCGRCRRVFEDNSVTDVPRWMVANLDAEVLPDFDMVWDRTRKWEPPGFRRTNQRRNRSNLTPRQADIGGRNDGQLVSKLGEGWSRSGEWRVVSLAKLGQLIRFQLIDLSDSS